MPQKVRLDLREVVCSRKGVIEHTCCTMIHKLCPASALSHARVRTLRTRPYSPHASALSTRALSTRVRNLQTRPHSPQASFPSLTATAVAGRYYIAVKGSFTFCGEYEIVVRNITQQEVLASQ